MGATKKSFLNWSVEMKVIRGFAAGLAVLGLVGFVSFFTIFRLLDAKRQVEQTQRVLRQIEIVLSDITDAETSQRGYLLTGQNAYLEPYNRALINLKPQIAELRNLTSANSLQQSRVITLEQLVDAKLNELKQTVELRRSQGSNAALDIVLTNQGKFIMDAIRALLQEMENTEEELLAQRLAASNSTAQLTLILLPVAALLALILLTLALVSVVRDNRRRQQAESEVWALNSGLEERVKERTAELRAANRRVNDILTSITDAFLVIDKDWCFTYLNPQAEVLLGRTRDQILNQNIWEIFPEMVNTAFYSEYHLAVEQQIAVNFQEFYPTLNSWFEVRVYPWRAGLSVYLQDISYQKQIEATHEIELRRQTALSAVALAVNSAASLTEIVSAVVKNFCHELKGASASIFLLQADERFGEGLAGVGFATDEVVGMQIDLQNLPHSQQAIEQQKPLYFTINETAGAERNYFESLNFVGSLVTPLLVGANPIGLAYVNYQQFSQAPQLAELNFARDLATQCALAINKSNLLKERSQLLAEVQQRANELEMRVLEVQTALRQRDSFLNIAAHELRTPLTSLKLILQLAQREVARLQILESTRGLQSLNKSAAQVNRLERLIDDMVETTKVLEGELRLNFEPLNLVQIIHAAASDFLDSEIHSIEIKSSSDELLLQADKLKLSHVLRNLLDNAIKFSPNGGKIEVKIEQEQLNKRALVSIKDYGTGIADLDREAIFLPYFQADSNYRSRRFGGMGLGLFVSRAIIEGHQGQLNLLETSENGTTFTVELPLL